MTNMRYAVWTGGRDFHIEEQPVPEPGPGQVRVRVSACGVCMTEVHTIDGLIGKAKPPWVMGHEWGGVIDALGPDVSGLELGTAVACAGQRGFSEYGVLAANRVFPIPAGVPAEESAQVEPLVCCVSAVECGELPPAASILVTGAGPMGLMLIQIARRRGATRVLVSEPNPDRRALALRLGADQAVDPRQTPVREAARAFTQGAGVDVAFETAGNPAPLADCLASVKDYGMAVLVGVDPASARLDLEIYPFHYHNITLRASYGSTRNLGFADAAKWLGQIDVASVVSHRFDLADIAAAFDVARTGRGLKVIVGAGLGQG